MDQYPNQEPITVSQPAPEAPAAVEPPQQPQNGVEQTAEQNASNLLFDSLIGDMPPHMQQQQQQPQTSSTLNDAELEMNRANEFVPSDDDDYEAPASVGPVSYFFKIVSQS